MTKRTFCCLPLHSNLQNEIRQYKQITCRVASVIPYNNLFRGHSSLFFMRRVRKQYEWYDVSEMCSRYVLVFSINTWGHNYKSDNIHSKRSHIDSFCQQAAGMFPHLDNAAWTLELRVPQEHSTIPNRLLCK
jgi:hypothetical protein